MKNLEIKLLLPYNWAHMRRIRIYDDRGNLLVRIKHCEHVLVKVSDDCKHVTIRLDFYKSVIAVPQDEENLFLGVYMDFRDYFPYRYLDTLKIKCLTGRFMSAEAFDNYSLDIYDQSANYLPVKKFDRQAVYTGLFISAGLIVTSVAQQENPSQDLLFFIGMGSFISLLILNSIKNTIMVFDYKSRLIATGFAFILAFFFLEHSFAITALFFIFISTFIMQAWASITSIQST